MCDDPDDLNYDCNYNMFLAKTMLGNLRLQQDRMKAQRWLRKLSLCNRSVQEMKLRNDFMYHLVLNIQSGELQPPFSQNPPAGPLPAIAQLLKQDWACVMAVERNSCQQLKQYDYLLKFLLVGDSDVGKQEILSNLEDGSSESPFCSGSAYKTTTILLDGKRVKLQLWDTSGQGRFCTIIRSYSRGAQGILLVYDITNKWSFDGIDRWLKEVEEHAPGVPKVLVGNRLHLAFKRQVTTREAENYASKNSMAFFEVSPLCDFNITESFSELSRRALHRNGMERLWRSNKVLSLQELCCRSIVARTTVYGIDQLPLPSVIKSHLKSYAMTSYTTVSSPCGMGPGVTVGGCGGPLGSGIGSGGGGGATGCLSAAGQSLSSRVISASYKKSRAGSGASVYHQGSGLVSATVSPCFLPGGGGNQPHHHPPRNSCCIS